MIRSIISEVANAGSSVAPKKIFRTRNSGSVVRRGLEKHDGLPKPISEFDPGVREQAPISTPAQGALTRTVIYECSISQLKFEAYIY